VTPVKQLFLSESVRYTSKIAANKALAGWRLDFTEQGSLRKTCIWAHFAHGSYKSTTVFNEPGSWKHGAMVKSRALGLTWTDSPKLLGASSLASTLWLVLICEMSPWVPLPLLTERLVPREGRWEKDGMKDTSGYLLLSVG